MNQKGFKKGEMITEVKKVKTVDKSPQKNICQNHRRKRKRNKIERK